jgi:hypothetical protein
MARGLIVGEGEVVGFAVKVGASVTGGLLPGRAQEASRIKGRKRKASFCFTGETPGNECRYFT